METLQLLTVCFLLPSTHLSDVQTEFANFICDENVTAEIGKDINITCISNKEITSVSVKFCINKTSCSSDIGTLKKIWSADNGRIALEINITSVILRISRVQNSDERIYRFFLFSENGYKQCDVDLRVADPVPSTTERVVTKTAIYEKVKSEETNHRTIILVLILMLLVVFGFAVALYCRKKKGVKLPCGKRQMLYAQKRFTEVSF